MMQKDTQAILIALFFFCTYLFLFQNQIGMLGEDWAIDYSNYLSCANDGKFKEVPAEADIAEQQKHEQCERYPPITILIFEIFSGRTIWMQQFLLFVFAFIAPLIIYKITGEPIAALLYFSFSFFSYAITTAVAQPLSLLLILSMLFLKDWQRILILPLLILVHSYAFVIGVAFFAMIKAWELLNDKLPGAFLVCSPFWGQTPESVQTVLIQQTTNEGVIRINTILSFLTKRSPLPFLILGTKKLIEMRHIPLLGFMAMMLFGALTIHERALHFVALPVMCGMAWQYRDANNKWKAVIIATALIFIAVQVWQLLALGQNC